MPDSSSQGRPLGKRMPSCHQRPPKSKEKEEKIRMRTKIITSQPRGWLAAGWAGSPQIRISDDRSRPGPWLLAVGIFFVEL